LSGTEVFQDTNLEEQFKYYTIKNLGKLLGGKETAKIAISVVNDWADY